MTETTPTAAEKAYAALKELADLADLAARHGWRLDRCHSVLNEIAWHRSGHRIVVTLTATGGIRRCGFGYETEPDPIEADWRYGADGGVTLAEGEGASPMMMLFWDRRSAGAAGLVGMVRRWLAATPGVGIGDLILFEGQWSPVTAVAAGHVTVIQGRGGRVQTVTLGRYEIEGHQFARPVYELSAEMAGRWLVVSQGSTHLWDLESMTYTRLPGPTSASTFPCDGEPMAITRVGRWPAVGSTSMVWFDDPEHPQTREQWRQSSTIIAIVSVPAG